MAKKPTYEELEQRVKDLEKDAAKHKNTEEALRESEEKLLSITDTAVDSIFCKDINQRYTFVNPAMLRLLGCTKADLIGKVPEEVFDKEDAAIVAEVDERTLNGENVSQVRSLSVAGKPYVFHTIQVPLHDSDGNITGISGIVRDTTDFEQAREALQTREKLINALLNNQIDAATVVDKELKMLYVNEFLAERFGRSVDEMIGLSPEDEVDKADIVTAKRVAYFKQVATTGKPVRFEDKREGIWFDTVVTPVLDQKGQVARLFHLQHDVVCLISIHMGSGRNHLHFHGGDLHWGLEILHDHAEPGDGRPAVGRIYKDRHSAGRVGRSVHDLYAGKNFPVGADGLNLSVFLHILDVVLQVPEIQRVRVVNAFQFLFVDVKGCIGALVVIFAVIIVQMRMDYRVDILRCKTPLIQTFFKGMNLSANFFLPVRGADGAHFPGVHQDFSVSAFQIPGVNGNAVRLSVAVLIGHHSLVKQFGTHHNGMNPVGRHDTLLSK